MGTREDERSREQAVVDSVYAVLDRTRDAYRAKQRDVAAQAASGSPQNRSERDVLAAHYGDQAQRLTAVEDKLVFGRLDPLDGPPRYIGRVGLTDRDSQPILIDWRAPAAQPFYQATASNPDGMARRRHLFVRARTVEAIEDEVFDVSAASSSGLSLQGEGALMAALAAGRSGHMGDIISTIQAEQDRIIRTEQAGLVVVQGGPGTGKTAVALHRAAYLLYAQAERLSRSGVLIVGPSVAFLRYIEQVLPTLGETGVVSTTIGGLVPGLRAEASESAEVAALKGDMRWVGILKQATRSLERVPAAPIPLVIDGVTLHMTPAAVAAARRHARLSSDTHNGGREAFVRHLLSSLVDAYIAAAKLEGREFGESDRAWIREEIRTDRNVRREVNLCWMPYAPDVFLRRLFARPALLAQVAGNQLTAAERALLVRDADQPLTEADIVLIDELTESLGDFEDPRMATQRSLAARQRERELEMAKQTLSNAGMTPGLVNAGDLVDRANGPLRGVALAEQANRDRTWTYGHVVVDEAQELSPLAWNALMRRCPSRSFTVVGDLAQRHAGGPSRTWEELLGPAARALSAEMALTVCYRTPATIMEAAERVVTAAGRPSPYPPRPVRDSDDCLEVVAVDAIDAPTLAGLVDAECARLDRELGPGEGRVAAIVPTRLAQPLAAELGWGSDTVNERVVLLDAAASKGLEFDAVVLDEPAAIAEASLGDLYVAMTRPTARLVVAHAADLPAGLLP
ncbi:MAG: AAA family ATPase [Actinomycetaceae bacterium]|nr:AAA family ATPase [Actinomycetaceae bacterium]MDU0970030.1 AAA family ATPase [Actinomycetaceae bacterium]